MLIRASRLLFITTCFALSVTPSVFAQSADREIDPLLDQLQQTWPSENPNPESVPYQSWAKRLQELKSRTFATDAERSTISSLGYSQASKSYSLSLTILDPAIPFTGVVPLTPRNAGEIKTIDQGLKAGTLKARIEYQVWAPAKGLGRVVIRQAHIGLLDSTGKFAVLQKLPVSGIWDFEPGKRSNPKPANLVDAIVIEGGGSYTLNNGRQSVTIPVAESFMMSRTVVSQALYEQVMGTNPSTHRTKPDSQFHPVETLNFFDAMEFCNRLSILNGLQPVYTIKKLKVGEGSVGYYGYEISPNYLANGWRLPFTSEFSYAAQGGLKSGSYHFAGSNNAGEVSWFKDNSRSSTHPVGRKKANELGLFDMMGNVEVWLDAAHGKMTNEIPLGGASYAAEESKLTMSAPVSRYGSYNQRKPSIGIRLVRNEANLPPPPALVLPETKGGNLNTLIGALDATLERGEDFQAQSSALSAGRWIVPEDKLQVDLPIPGSQFPFVKIVSNDSAVPFTAYASLVMDPRQIQRLHELKKAGNLVMVVQFTVLPVDKGLYRAVITFLDAGYRLDDGSLVSLKLVNRDFEPWNYPSVIPKGKSWIGTPVSLPATAKTNALFLAPRPVDQEIWHSLQEGGGNVGIYLPYAQYTNPLAPVDLVQWINTLILCNKLSLVEGLQPVYTLGELANDPRGPRVTADFSKSGWRLPNSDEAALIAHRPSFSATKAFWIWDSGKGLEDGGRGTVSTGSGGNLNISYRDPVRGADTGLGVAVVRRDPKTAPVLAEFKGALPDATAAPLPVPTQSFVLVNKALGANTWLALDANTGEVKLVEGDPASKVTVWRALTPIAGAPVYQLQINNPGTRNILAAEYYRPPSPDYHRVVGIGDDTTVSWRFVPSGDGWYYLIDTIAGSARVLTAVNPNSEDPVLMGPLKPGSAGQLWKPVSLASLKPEAAAALDNSLKNSIPEKSLMMKADGSVHRWVAGDWQEIKHYGNPIVNVSVRPNGEAVFSFEQYSLKRAIDSTGAFWNIYPRDSTIYITDANGQDHFEQKLGTARDIAVGGDDSVWIIGTKAASGGYQILYKQGQEWIPIDGAAVRIAVDPQGNPWVVNDLGVVYRRENNAWKKIDGILAKGIAIGRDGKVLLIRRDGSGTQTPTKLTDDIFVIGGAVTEVALP